MRLTKRLRSGLSILRWREFAVAVGVCPFCGRSVLVRLCRDPRGLRCLRCAAGLAHLSLGKVMRQRKPDLGSLDVCELSAQGPLADHLRRHARSAAVSEYFPEAARGELHDGVRCEDVLRLTYPDATFDLVTHTEVLEHVADDARALSELHRVLKPGGLMLFTVPLHGGEATIERARIRGGTIEHLLPPVYHRDPLRREGILAFRDYGSDIIGRLQAAGFERAWIVPSEASGLPWGFGYAVVCAERRSCDEHGAPSSSSAWKN